MKPVLKTLAGQTVFPPPIWMMRQAGRYLPEYRRVRDSTGSFLDLCYNPKLACEVTLQPIRRFGFDAAILFSDILVIAQALGRKLVFQEGQGPILEPIEVDDIATLEMSKAIGRLNPIFETLDLLSHSLPQEVTLIGFCGAPWTVATYMIAGHGTPDQGPARLFAYKNPRAMESLLQSLAEISAEYLIAQIEAGAEVVQIFDSWAGVLDEQAFEVCCIQPITTIVQRVKKQYPQVPIIGFPKGAGLFYQDYQKKTGVTALGLDWTTPLQFAFDLQKKSPIQGNLDPLRLLAGGKSLDEGVEMILNKLGRGPLIFNLGHGITPQTPIAHVEQMVRRVRGKR